MQYESVIFDFDSTIVSIETFDMLAEVALQTVQNKADVLAAIKEVTNLGMTGAIPLEESFKRRMALVSLTRAHIESLIPRMASYLSPSFACNAKFFEAEHKRCFIVSGGFSELIYPVADVLHIPRAHVFANAFVYDDAGAVIGLDTTRPTCRAGGKAQQILDLEIERPVVMIGDGMTDYEAKRLGGVDAFIAYTEYARRDAVCAAADSVAEDFNSVVHFLQK
jgi:D-3-phosphoglycerate dehydrogenase / 2-oxoglutarate reductase